MHQPTNVDRTPFHLPLYWAVGFYARRFQGGEDLPYHYIEIASLMFDVAAEDIKEENRVRTTLEVSQSIILHFLLLLLRRGKRDCSLGGCR